MPSHLTIEDTDETGAVIASSSIPIPDSVSILSPAGRALIYTAEQLHNIKEKRRAKKSTRPQVPRPSNRDARRHSRRRADGPA